jgi:4a-hydroxytetrahydrobiopterin dehydratase
MATLLDEPLLQETLEALPGWTGDRTHISRDVHLPPAKDAALRAQVEQDADAMDHHPEVTRVDGGTRFVLSTHSEGGVTELDVALASRISDIAHRLSPKEPGVEAVRQDNPDVVAGDDAGMGLQTQDAFRTSQAARR